MKDILILKIVLTIASSLLISGLTVVAEPSSTVRFEQTAVPSPFVNNRWLSHGFSVDLGYQVFDDIEFEKDEIITEIRWGGVYLDQSSEPHPVDPNTDSWVIEIRSDNQGEPGQVVYTESFEDGGVPRDIVGHMDGFGTPRAIIPRFEFSFVLESPFQTTADTVYWVSALSKAQSRYPEFQIVGGFPSAYAGPLRDAVTIVEETSEAGQSWQKDLATGDLDSLAGNFALKILTLPVEDVDQDGMDDEWESTNKLNTSVDDSALDPDKDGLSNLDEFERRTDPQEPDTDEDGVVDLHETNTGFYVSSLDRGSHPLVPDTDGDGICDGLEIPHAASSGRRSKSDPNLSDTDSDGLDDGTERVAGTNPSSTDTDNDGITDRWEEEHGTDPKNARDPARFTVSIPLAAPPIVANQPYYDPTPNEFFVDGDQSKDATFRLLVDFEPKQGKEREILLETGSQFGGLALTYEEGNRIALHWRGVFSEDTPLYQRSLVDISKVLTDEQIEAGPLELVWGFDTLNDDGKQSVGLWINGILCDEQKLELGSTWTTRGDAAFALHPQKGTIYNEFMSGSSAPFSSGTIDLSTGLEYYRDIYPITSYVRQPLIRGISVDRVACEVSVEWTSDDSAFYAIEKSMDLKNWVGLADRLPGDGPTTTYVDRRGGELQAQAFYRIRLSVEMDVGGHGCCGYDAYGGGGGEE